MMPWPLDAFVKVPWTQSRPTTSIWFFIQKYLPSLPLQAEYRWLTQLISLVSVHLGGLTLELTLLIVVIMTADLTLVTAGFRNLLYSTPRPIILSASSTDCDISWVSTMFNADILHYSPVKNLLHVKYTACSFEAWHLHVALFTCAF